MTVTKKPLVYRNVFPRVAIPVAQKGYPDWLERTLENPNIPVPESIIREYEPSITPYSGIQPKTLGGEPIPPAKYVPPPAEVHQRPKIPVKFKVLNAFDRPIFNFSIRANDQNLITDKNGNASIEVYQGFPLTISTGRESGWSYPNGARRKVRMTGMMGISDTFQMDTPGTIILYPESGEYNTGDGVIRQQTITYATG